MHHFPVTNSNLSAAHLGLFLKEKYALDPETTCQIIKAGINDTYLVTNTPPQYKAKRIKKTSIGKRRL